MLAWLRRHSYLGVLAGSVAASCQPKPASVAPAAGFVPSTREAFAQAARATAPSQRQVIRLTWRSDDGRLQLSGNGAARVAPPDSMRVDIAAALGLGRATVIFTGDGVVAQPPALVDQVLPDRFALWAVLGVMRAPSDIATVARFDDGTQNVWRVTDAAGRLTIFELSGGALSAITRSEGERTTSQLRLTRGDDGQVRRANLTDYAHSLRLEVEITGREASEPFAAETWRLRP